MLYIENNKALGDKVKHAKSARTLEADATKNGKRLNERKARSIALSKIFYAQAEKIENENLALKMKKRAGRIYGCCSHREIAINSERYAYTLHTHRCKDRNCVECQRVRAFVLQEKIRAITPALIEQTRESDGLIFGTLTIKNPPLIELKKYLKLMSRAFARLMTRKKLKAAGRGGFRCFEITRGNIEDHCHPHIHFLLQVDKKYFNNKGLYYMRAEEWAEEWTKCIEAEAKKAGLPFDRADYPNGRAFVKILRVQSAESVKNAKNGGKRQYATISDLQTQGDHVINYVLKYSAKEDENSEKALVKNDQWFIEYDKQIKGIRAISFFGIYKDLIAELPQFEYNEEDIRAQIECEEANEKREKVRVYSAIWCDDHQYVLSDQTLEEALNKKRLNIVNTIKRTLKIQIENQNISLNLIINSMKNKDYMVTNKAIIELNKIKARTRATFARLEKTGEVKNLKDVYNYEFNAELINDLDPLFTELEIKQIIKQNQKAFEILDATINCPF
ncbi:TPA: protein rep [Providencia stuartii]|nr:protein rep [Providencia stuartii]